MKKKHCFISEVNQESSVSMYHYSPLPISMLLIAVLCMASCLICNTYVFHAHLYPLSIFCLFLNGTILLVHSHDSNALERKEDDRKSRKRMKRTKEQRRNRDKKTIYTFNIAKPYFILLILQYFFFSNRLQLVFVTFLISDANNIKSTTKCVLLKCIDLINIIYTNYYCKFVQLFDIQKYLHIFKEHKIT